MKTVQEWLDGILADEKLFYDWLRKQYIGEMSAYERVKYFARNLPEGEMRDDIMSVALDEWKHSNYVYALLMMAGEDDESGNGEFTTEMARNLYWNETLFEDMTVSQVCAVGAHAEEMRLHRIVAIRDCERMPNSYRKVFSKIYDDELRHCKIFRKWCSDEDYEAAKENHQNGLNALGLVL